jgi:BMFP domain-containing protein YqiC
MKEYSMFDPKKLEQMAKQIHDAMPQPVKELGTDMESRVRQAIQGQLTKLDVVSREEFDVQTQVLLRTRQKLTELEAKLEEMETKIGQSQDNQ